MRLWNIYHPTIPGIIAEAIDAPEMLRLQNVGMNCGCEYTSFPLFQRIHEPYSRFDHSVGVALLIWRFTANHVNPSLVFSTISPRPASPMWLISCWATV